MKKNRKKWILALPALILLAALAAVIITAARGADIRESIMRRLGMEVPRDVGDTYGYYGQAVKTKQDLRDLAGVAENDESAAHYDSNIPVLQSPAGFTAGIDAMITEELQSGQYAFDDPMVIQDAFQNSPLTALALFTTEEAQPVRVRVKGKTPSADVVYTTPAQTAHRVPLIGLYPSLDNTVELALLDGDGMETAARTLTVRTSGLPDRMDGMMKPVTVAGGSAYGLTMVYGQACKRPFAYDCNGDIRWYLDQETGFYGLYNLSDGRFMLQDASSYTYSVSKPQSVTLYEMDYLGRTYQVYYLPYGTHHDVIEKTPGGNLLCLTSSMETHYEDVIEELDRETGRTVNRLKLSDVFLNNIFTYKLDWAHINTVSWQPEDDTILISARNVHSVMKIGWSDHKLKWILCDPSFWKNTAYAGYVLTPEDDNTLWHYQQHTSYRIPEDLDNDPDTIEISVFDNHIHTHRKVKTFTDTGLSYATVYAVNERAKTVRVIKQLEVLQSDVCSNTVYDGESGHIFAMSGIVSDEAHPGYQGMTYEFDYSSGKILNQFAIRGTFYRATEMILTVDPACEPVPASDHRITGSLPRPKAVKANLPGNVPAAGPEVTLTRTGSTLFLEAKNRRLSQVIFAGGKNTYVYDSTGILLESDKYDDFIINTPVSLQNLEPDEYRLFGVYEDRLCRLTVNGEEAYITATAP